MSAINSAVEAVAVEAVEAVAVETTKGFFSSALSAVARNPVVAVGVVAGTAAVVYGTIKLRAYRAAKADDKEGEACAAAKPVNGEKV